MYARSTTIQAQPSSIDAGVAHVRDEVMPALTQIDGCVGLSLLVDRESGRCIATTAWENEAAMRARAEQPRTRAAETRRRAGGRPRREGRGGAARRPPPPPPPPRAGVAPPLCWGCGP